MIFGKKRFVNTSNGANLKVSNPENRDQKMSRNRSKYSRKSVLDSYEKQPLDKVFALFRPYRRMLLTGFVLTIIFDMIALTVPWMLKISVDKILPSGDYMLFSILAVVMLIIYLSRCMVRYMLSSTVDYTGIRLIVDIRQ